MEAILTFILFAVLGYYVLGFIGRLWLRRFLRRQQQRFESSGGSYSRAYSQGKEAQQNGDQKREGEVFVSITEKEKKVNTNVGDYVEFEEISTSAESQES